MIKETDGIIYVAFGDLLKAICKTHNKWGMYISWDASFDTCEVKKAAPYLPARICGDGNAVLLFDSEEDCYKAYKSTVGDDGPTESNSYNGQCRVYALTCTPKGCLQNENT